MARKILSHTLAIFANKMLMRMYGWFMTVGGGKNFREFFLDWGLTATWGEGDTGVRAIGFPIPLSTSWFFWLNRREIGTQYENLPPMNESGDNLKILSWYPVVNEKNPGCPVCGDFIGTQLKKLGIQEIPNAEETSAFKSDS